MQFMCLGDWEQVMEEGPWTFKGKAMVLAPYDGFTRPSSIALDTVEIWVCVSAKDVGWSWLDVRRFYW